MGVHKQTQNNAKAKLVFMVELPSSGGFPTQAYGEIGHDVEKSNGVVHLGNLLGFPFRATDSATPYCNDTGRWEGEISSLVGGRNDVVNLELATVLFSFLLAYLVTVDQSVSSTG